MHCLCPGTTDDHSCGCPAPNPRGASWDENQAFGLPHVHDGCFCARDNVAEPFSTCGNTGSGCGGCSDEFTCSLAPGCSLTSGACTCDSGYSVSTLCDGAGNLQTFFFDSSAGTCDDPSSAAGVFDTPIDEDDGGRCDNRGRQGSEEDGWFDLYGREASCQGVAAGEPPRAVYFMDPGCDGEPLPVGDPRVPHSGSTWEGLKNCACCEPSIPPPSPAPPPPITSSSETFASAHRRANPGRRRPRARMRLPALVHGRMRRVRPGCLHHVHRRLLQQLGLRLLRAR